MGINMTNSSNIELSTERKLLATKKAVNLASKKLKHIIIMLAQKNLVSSPSVNMDIKILVTSILFTSLLITDNLKNKF